MTKVNLTTNYLQYECGWALTEIAKLNGQFTDKRFDKQNEMKNGSGEKIESLRPLICCWH